MKLSSRGKPDTSKNITLAESLVSKSSLMKKEKEHPLSISSRMERKYQKRHLPGRKRNASNHYLKTLMLPFRFIKEERALLRGSFKRTFNSPLSTGIIAG